MIRRDIESIGEVVSRVYKTFEYEYFSRMPGNRPHVTGHIKKLIKSFKQKQLPIPIVVNEHGYIIDGQHRFETLKCLGLPIYYIILDKATLEDCVLLNQVSLNWTLQDFITSNIDLQDKNYIKAQEFMKRYPEIKHKRAYFQLLTHTASQHAKVTNSIREGKLEIINYEQACKNAEMLLDFKISDDVWCQNYILAAMNIIKLQKYNHSQMKSKLAIPRLQQKIKKGIPVTQYYPIFTTIYNDHVVGYDDRLYFEIETPKNMIQISKQRKS